MLVPYVGHPTTSWSVMRKCENSVILCNAPLNQHFRKKHIMTAANLLVIFKSSSSDGYAVAVAAIFRPES